MTDSPPSPRFDHTLPYLILLAVGGAFFGYLLLRGLDLGFTHDSLRLIYFYQRDGIAPTTRWVLDFDSRHLLSGFYYAALQILFPNQSWAWYAATFALQIGCGLLLVLLWQTVMSGRWRGWGLAAALLFTYHAGQRVTFFQVTVCFALGAMAASLLALWAYARYVIGGRQGRLWRDAALLLYAFGVMTYESTALWPLAMPVVAWLVEQPSAEEAGATRRSPLRRDRAAWAAWWRRVVVDLWLFPVVAAAYWLLVQFYHPPSWWSASGPGDSLGSFVQALLAELTPLSLLREFGPAFEGPWLILTLALIAGLGAALFLRWNHSAAREDGPSLGGGLLLAFLLGATALAPAAVAANETFSRVVHAGTIGAALWLVGMIAAGEWLARRAVPARAGIVRAAAALLCALLIAPGMTAILIERDTVAARTASREAALDAVQAALPSLPAAAPPYLLLIPDAHPFDLGFDAQDLRFPLFFDLRYGINAIDADMLYPAEAIPAAQWPDPAVDPLAYRGQVLIVTDEGIVSPLRPGEVIPEARVILLRLEGGAAVVLDRVDAADLRAYNVDWRRESPLRTNTDFLADEG